jgi:hypothetical protein
MHLTSRLWPLLCEWHASGTARLDAGGPEGHPGAVGHGPGLGDQAVYLDRVALADARAGQVGTRIRAEIVAMPGA